MKNADVNPYIVDHLVVNVDDYYQNDHDFIKKVNLLGLPYVPAKGKSTKGFKATNLWIGDEYFELIHIKTEDGGGWIKDWTNRYHSGHRGLIGLFLKTENIKRIAETCHEFGISEPERITFPIFFNLINLSAKWKNAYLPFFERSPFQIGFQQVDNEKIEKRIRARMMPNSSENGITGIKTIKYYGPFNSTEFEWLKRAFVCSEIDSQHLAIPLMKNQSISLCISDDIKTEVTLYTENIAFPPLEIGNLTILSDS